MYKVYYIVYIIFYTPDNTRIRSDGHMAEYIRDRNRYNIVTTEDMHRFVRVGMRTVGRTDTRRAELLVLPTTERIINK